MENVILVRGKEINYFTSQIFFTIVINIAIIICKGVIEMITKVVKVSKKGQITLPREIRKKLGTEVVKIVAQGDSVRIEPVKELAGSLKRYASKYIPMKQAREKAWTEVVSEKHGIRD